MIFFKRFLERDLDINFKLKNLEIGEHARAFEFFSIIGKKLKRSPLAQYVKNKLARATKLGRK